MKQRYYDVLINEDLQAINSQTRNICISFIWGWCTNYTYYLPKLVHNLDNLHVRSDSLDDHTGIHRCTHHTWFLLFL